MYFLLISQHWDWLMVKGVTKKVNMTPVMKWHLFHITFFIWNMFRMQLTLYLLNKQSFAMITLSSTIWVRSRNCGCLVTCFCYQLIAKPGNKTAAVSWPDPYDTQHSTPLINSLVPERCRRNFKSIFLKLISQLHISSTSCEIVLSKYHRTLLMIIKNWFR